MGWLFIERPADVREYFESECRVDREDGSRQRLLDFAIVDLRVGFGPSFAWFLREEAFRRFGFDPDRVFGPDVTEPHALGEATPEYVALSESTTSREPRAVITAKRLTFKANVIEPLADGDVFEIRTPDATWRMTKAEFYQMFPKVIVSESYAGPGRLYSYTSPPARIEKYRVE